MSYKDTIEQLKSSVSSSLVDLDSERTRGRPPSQAYSEFLTNREQGDWAETLILKAINETSKTIMLTLESRFACASSNWFQAVSIFFTMALSVTG